MRMGHERAFIHYYYSITNYISLLIKHILYTHTHTAATVKTVC